MRVTLSPLFTSIFLAFSLPIQAQTITQNSESFDSVYNIQKVTGMSLDKRAILGGAVISSSQVNLSAQVSGDVLNVSGQEGDMFKKGSGSLLKSHRYPQEA